MNARAAGSLSQIGIHGTDKAIEYILYCIEMFSKRSAECKDIKKFAESLDSMLSIERLSGDETKRSLQSD